MGTIITHINAVNERKAAGSDVVIKKEVTQLAVTAIRPLLDGQANSVSHLITATSCPDSLAPSLGQSVVECLHSYFEQSTCIDLVQGCAGGVSALILGAQLAEVNRSAVMVVASDAAQKACSVSSPVYPIFSNGAFACVINYTDAKKGLLKFKSRQFKNLSEVVTIKLGHDADEVIQANLDDMAHDPRKHLGLTLNNGLAIQLMKRAEQFYVDFISDGNSPDVLLLHQANPLIMQHLQQVFSKYPVQFINQAIDVGNCGASTTGVVLHRIYNELKNKKVMICSFGTGGVITAGLWQF